MAIHDGNRPSKNIRYILPIVTNGLSLHLDAGNSTSYPGTGTTWFDISGNGNNGTLTNGPTFSSTNGGSIVFDGINDLMTTSFTIQAATSSNLQTYCSWLNGRTTNNSFFGSSASSTGQFHLILNFNVSQQLSFGASFFGGGSAGDQTNVVTVNSNPTWNYACIVKTAAQTFDVYLNGEKVITGAIKTANQPSSFNLGRWWNVQYIPSNVSVVQMYNRALSANEITQNFNALKNRFGL
jgi:hypothetical protein